MAARWCSSDSAVPLSSVISPPSSPRGCGCGNARAQIAKSEPPRHRGEASDLAADAQCRQQPDAGEQQQRGHRQHRHILVEAAVGGGNQAVLGQSHHDVEAGIPDRRRAGDGPDMRPAVGVRHLVEGPAARLRPQTGTGPSSRSTRRRARSSPCPAGQQGRCLSCRRARSPCRSADACRILGEFAQVERRQQDEFQLAGFRACRVGDLQHRLSRSAGRTPAPA